MDVALLDRDLGAHRLQALDVLIDRPRPDGAAAGQRHARLAAARDERPEDEDRGAHGLDHLVGGDRIVEAAAVEDHAIDTVHGHADAHAAEQAQHGRNVVELRHIGKMQRLGGEQRRAENRQRGVLGAGDGDLAGKRGAAADQKLIHAGRSTLRASAS